MTEAEELELLELEEAKAKAAPPAPFTVAARGPAAALFPSGGGNIPSVGRRALADVGDILSAPSRLAAMLRGQSMTDPNAYLLRPEFEKAQAKYEATPPGPERDQPFSAPPQFMPPSGVPFTPATAGKGSPSEFAYQQASDPLNLLGGLGIVRSLGRKFLTPLLARLAGKSVPAIELRAGAGGAEKVAESIASGEAKKLSAAQAGFEFPILRMEASAEGRAGASQLEKLREQLTGAKKSAEAASFRAVESKGKEIEEAFEQVRDPKFRKQYFPEHAEIESIVKVLPPESVYPAVKEMENARDALIGVTGIPDPEVAQLLPKINSWIDYLKGLDKGTDAAERARFYKSHYPAEKIRDLRISLDQAISSFDPVSQKILDKVLKPGRRALEKSLQKSAAASGHPEYAKAMDSWSQKLRDLEEMEPFFGGGSGAGARLISTLRGIRPGVEAKREIVNRFEKLSGKKFQDLSPDETRTLFEQERLSKEISTTERKILEKETAARELIESKSLKARRPIYSVQEKLASEFMPRPGPPEAGHLVEDFLTQTGAAPLSVLALQGGRHAFNIGRGAQPLIPAATLARLMGITQFEEGE